MGRTSGKAYLSETQKSTPIAKKTAVGCQRSAVRKEKKNLSAVGCRKRKNGFCGY
jgi:hypothetical protein